MTQDDLSKIAGELRHMRDTLPEDLFHFAVQTTVKVLLAVAPFDHQRFVREVMKGT